MSNTTKYTVLAGDTVVLEGLTKRAKAIEAATAHRDEAKVAVRVVTSNGKEVFSQAAPKKINMTPKYTRTVELPEGVILPEGMRAAYKRPRRNAVILHDGELYHVLKTDTNEVLEQTFNTSREVGSFLVNA